MFDRLSYILLSTIFILLLCIAFVSEGRAELPEPLRGPHTKYQLTVIKIFDTNSAMPFIIKSSELRGLRKGMCEHIADNMRVTHRKERLTKEDIILTVCSLQLDYDV